MPEFSPRETVTRIWEARIAGDVAALRAFLSPDATYEMVGANAFADPALVGPARAGEAVSRLVEAFRFHSVKEVTAVFDGHTAAVVNRVQVSFGDAAPVTTEVCDLWTFGADGKVVSLRQFLDTDLIRRTTSAGG